MSYTRSDQIAQAAERFFISMLSLTPNMDLVEEAGQCLAAAKLIYGDSPETAGATMEAATQTDLLTTPYPWRLRWWTDQYAADVPDQAAELARQRALLVAPKSPINQPGYSESDDEIGEGVLTPAGLWDEMYQAWLWRQQNG